MRCRQAARLMPGSQALAPAHAFASTAAALCVAFAIAELSCCKLRRSARGTPLIDRLSESPPKKNNRKERGRRQPKPKPRTTGKGQARKRRITCLTHRSQRRIVHDPIIHKETMNTMRTVPGHIVIRVFKTNRVLKLIRLRAPMLRELASVNNLLWSSMTRQIK